MQTQTYANEQSFSTRRQAIFAGAVLAFWLLPSLHGHANGPTPVPGMEPPLRHQVRAFPIESNSVDAETSWLIEQDVPRIPNIAGLDRQLPPHIDRRLSYAFDLAQRGAIFTADAEFRAVLGLCALELDARMGGTSHREALRQGWIAIAEADQFGGDQADWREAADVRSVATGHATPVLRNAQAPVDSIQAVQAYYAFAEDRLTYASRGLPGASLAYYGLARTMLVPGNNLSHAAGKSALLHRVALAIAPQNVLAANELGVLLAQHGQLGDAAMLFRHCVEIDATPENWRNLAAVYARNGDEVASRSALAAGETLAMQERRMAEARATSTALAESAQSAKQSEDAEKARGIAAKFPYLPKLTNPFRR